MLPGMSGTTSSADSVGSQVTQILSEAQFTAAELLDEADRQAYRAGRQELTTLRSLLEDRIEALRAARTRVEQLAAETVPRIREAAAQLADMQASLADSRRDSMESALGLGEGEEATSGPRPQLAALIKAAETVAEELTKEARRRAQQIEQAARDEADRIASTEPERVTRGLDSAARRAETLRREMEALNRELDETGTDDAPEVAGVKERTGRWKRAR